MANHIHFGMKIIDHPTPYPHLRFQSLGFEEKKADMLTSLPDKQPLVEKYKDQNILNGKKK